MRTFLLGTVILFAGLPAAHALEGYDHAIDWYMANDDARKTVIATCDNDPGHLANDPDCINAKKADNQVGVDNVKRGMDNTVQGAADFFHGIGDKVEGK
jgi:hypothetical protein